MVSVNRTGGEQFRKEKHFDCNMIYEHLGLDKNTTKKLFDEITISEGEITLTCLVVSGQEPYVNKSEERPTYRDLYNEKVITRGFRNINNVNYAFDCKLAQRHESKIFSPDDKLIINIYKESKKTEMEISMTLGEAAARTGL